MRPPQSLDPCALISYTWNDLQRRDGRYWYMQRSLNLTACVRRRQRQRKIEHAIWRRQLLTYGLQFPAVTATAAATNDNGHYTSLFAQKEQHRKKQTIKKQQQTTKQTGINAALTMISQHMTCQAYLRVITEESVLKEIFQVIDIVDVTPIL